MEYLCLQSQPPVEVKKFPSLEYWSVPPNLFWEPSTSEQSSVQPVQLLPPLWHSHSSLTVSVPHLSRGQVPVDASARKESGGKRNRLSLSNRRFLLVPPGTSCRRMWNNWSKMYFLCQMFIGPRCLWGPIYGSGSLKLTESKTFCRLNWCDSGWWRYKLYTNW